MIKDTRFVKTDGKVLMLGNEALVRGCLEAGVSYVSQYPGTPTSDIGEYFHQVIRHFPEGSEFLPPVTLQSGGSGLISTIPDLVWRWVR